MPRQQLPKPTGTGCAGHVDRAAGAGGRVAGGTGLLSEREFAAKHGLSVPSVIGALRRGELVEVRCGSRVWVSEAAFQVKAIGMTPAELGAFVRAAGIASVDELVRFLGGEQ